MLSGLPGLLARVGSDELPELAAAAAGAVAAACAAQAAVVLEAEDRGVIAESDHPRVPAWVQQSGDQSVVAVEVADRLGVGAAEEALGGASGPVAVGGVAQDDHRGQDGPVDGASDLVGLAVEVAQGVGIQWRGAPDHGCLPAVTATDQDEGGLRGGGQQ